MRDKSKYALYGDELRYDQVDVNGSRTGDFRSASAASSDGNNVISEKRKP
jgi:hypothetical protein